ncbi:hypothetical protein ACQR2B_06810 [Bradyrhizobium oligotrophicum]|uniref:hypothetical protein n=1 Tax=Bradyrhizobium TaxID=374 RepID=UPI003EBFB0B3
MIGRLCLAFAAACTVLLLGAVMMATIIPEHPTERPPCTRGSIAALLTDCRSN